MQLSSEWLHNDGRALALVPLWDQTPPSMLGGASAAAEDVWFLSALRERLLLELFEGHRPQSAPLSDWSRRLLRPDWQVTLLCGVRVAVADAGEGVWGDVDGSGAALREHPDSRIQSIHSVVCALRLTTRQHPQPRTQHTAPAALPALLPFPCPRRGPRLTTHPACHSRTAPRPICTQARQRLALQRLLGSLSGVPTSAFIGWRAGDTDNLHAATGWPGMMDGTRQVYNAEAEEARALRGHPFFGGYGAAGEGGLGRAGAGSGAGVGLQLLLLECEPGRPTEWL